MPEADQLDWMPADPARSLMAKRLAAASAEMTSRALAEIAARHPWFNDLDAANRASIALVVRAGVDGFVRWFAAGAATVAPDNIFAAAPRSLTRSLPLHQTVDLIRTTITSVENHITSELAARDRTALRTAVLHYSREIAFDAAEVYARAAEMRGAWDARIEALVMDSVIRGEADESVISRASALGWRSPSGLVVVIGNLPSEEGAVEELRVLAHRAGVGVLAAPQGPRLVVLLGADIGGDEDAVRLASQFVDCFGEGPVVVGPVVADLVQAAASARAATAGRRAAVAWPAAPRPVAANALLPERALSGDGHARRQLAHEIFQPLAAHSGDVLATLEAFLDEGSIEATARLLFVHANTVRYRLAKVEELTGYSPGDPRDSYALRIALTLGRLLS